MAINEAFAILGSYGIDAEVFFPFFMIFAIIYATLQASRFLNKQSNIVISICIAAITIYSHVAKLYPPCWDVIDIINASIPRIGLLVMAIIAFIVILGVIRVDIQSVSWFLGVAVVIALLFVGYTFAVSGFGQCDGFVDFGGDFPWALLLPLGLFFGLIWFIMRGRGGGSWRMPRFDVY